WAALRDSKIGETETLKQQDDAAKWLEENLVVEFAENSEIMKIMLTGENPKDLADIVKAGQKGFMEEVVWKETSRNNNTIQIIEESQTIMEGGIKNQKNTVEATRVKPLDAPALPDSTPQKVRVGTVDFARMTEKARQLRAELEVAREVETGLVDKLAKVDTIE